MLAVRRGACSALIIGRLTDPHVRAVAELLPECGTVIIDAESLSGQLVSWDLKEAIYTDVAGANVEISRETGTNGWIRRLAPAGWDEGAVIGAKETASMIARLGTLGSIARDNHVQWLSLVDQTVATENKMVQYRAAISLGIDVPPAVIAGDVDSVRAAVGDDFIAKPIGPGNFIDAKGRPSVVYAQSVSHSDLEQVDLLRSPFVIQQRVPAKAHFRVVTVQGEAWVARLDAHELPLDWRSSEVAHGSFVGAEEPDLAKKALALANGLALGYSSQDWIRSKDGDYFVDLNPGGQWMFLPDAACSQIAAAVAGFLMKGR